MKKAAGAAAPAARWPSLTRRWLRLREDVVGDRPVHVAVAQVARRGAVLVILGLERREAVLPELLAGLNGLNAVELGVVAAEDRSLHRTVGRAERRIAELLLHVLRDLEPAQPLDLPLRRAGPQ